MPDTYFNAFPIPGKQVDFDAITADIDELQDDVEGLETDKADKTTTVNGQSLSANVVLKSAQFSEAITGEKMLANLTYRVVSTWT